MKNINYIELCKTIKEEYLNDEFIMHCSLSENCGDIFIIEKNGKGISKTYWFNDDNTTIYFEWLSVNEEDRKKGLGKKLLNIHIKLSKTYKLISCLWVIEDSWMHEWYKRNGYVDFKKHESEKNAIWMKLFI